ncbi:MAG: diacylglycerol kinase family lipid kinase [Oscillospiraceae bacterium]|nr:diacylglycerol kinase family lipid kinase [Oscillospiraceae bacterium]
MKKMLFVYNPRSGKGTIGVHLAEILDIFTKGGYLVTAHPTQERDDAYRLVKEMASDYDIVVSCGGDGTTNEMIKGICDGGHHVPVGSIPAGTMNDFSGSLGIPNYMPDAARHIVEGYPRYVDIGAFNERYFNYVAAFGVFTKVSYSTDQQMKNALGPLAYFIDAVKEASQNLDLSHHYTMTIRANGEEVRDTFIYGMVANSLSVGGIKGLAGEDVSMDDGCFEGIFIKNPKSIPEFNQTLRALARKEFDAPYFCYFRASDFDIRSDADCPWTVDGEYGGTYKNVSVCALHKVLQFYLTDDAPGLARTPASPNPSEERKG